MDVVRPGNLISPSLSRFPDLDELFKDAVKGAEKDRAIKNLSPFGGIILRGRSASSSESFGIPSGRKFVHLTDERIFQRVDRRYSQYFGRPLTSCMTIGSQTRTTKNGRGSGQMQSKFTSVTAGMDKYFLRKYWLPTTIFFSNKNAKCKLLKNL